MTHAFSSVSVVLVARDAVPSDAVLGVLINRLTRLFVDVELVIIANDVAPAVSLELKSLCDRLPDSLIVFLGDRVHDDLARLIGIDHAVSDHVLFATPTLIEADSLGLFEEPLQKGCDIVIGRPPERIARGVFNRALFAVFSTLFRWATGRVFEDEPPSFRILSRAAALHVATRKEGEVLVRARNLGSGYPTAEVRLPKDRSRPRAERSMRDDLSRGLRLISTGSATLLRASSYLALVGGIASAIYALYVIAVFFALGPNVAPGWTTLSLQLSGMMLLFSIQFLLLSEHVLQMAGTSGVAHRRHHIIRELRSPLSRRGDRLNIVDQQGRFEMGAPARAAQS